LVRKVTSSGMWAASRRSFASRVAAHHDSGRNSRWSSRADPAGVTPIRKTPTWQLSSLPSRPLCCRATPAECAPFLENADSSITPTVPTGEPVAEGTRVTSTFRGESRGFFKLAEPLVVRLSKRHWETAMDNARALLEDHAI